MFHRNRNLRTQTQERGITLLELLVVLTLIAILSAMVYPSFGNALASLRLKGAARQVVSVCRMAKWEAVRRRQPVRVSLDLNKGKIVVTDAKLTLIKELNLPPGIRFFQSQRISGDGAVDATDFYFYPNGTSDAGSIVLRDTQGRNLSVAIDSLTGDTTIASQ